MSLYRYPVDKHIVALFRRVFLRDDDSRAVLALLVRDMGHYSALSDDLREQGQQEYAKRLLQLCGMFYANRARGYIDAMAGVPEMWDPATDQKPKRVDIPREG